MVCNVIFECVTQTQKYGMQTEWLSGLKAQIQCRGAPVHENPAEANK